MSLLPPSKFMRDLSRHYNAVTGRWTRNPLLRSMYNIPDVTPDQSIDIGTAGQEQPIDIRIPPPVKPTPPGVGPAEGSGDTGGVGIGQGEGDVGGVESGSAFGGDTSTVQGIAESAALEAANNALDPFGHIIGPAQNAFNALNLEATPIQATQAAAFNVLNPVSMLTKAVNVATPFAISAKNSADEMASLFAEQGITDPSQAAKVVDEALTHNVYAQTQTEPVEPYITTPISEQVAQILSQTEQKAQPYTTQAAQKVKEMVKKAITPEKTTPQTFAFKPATVDESSQSSSMSLDPQGMDASPSATIGLDPQGMNATPSATIGLDPNATGLTGHGVGIAGGNQGAGEPEGAGNIGGVGSGSADSGDGGDGGGICIIVTVCTDRYSPEVNLARQYRDKFLDCQTLGGYYAIANIVVPIIKNSSFAKRKIKKYLVDRLIDHGNVVLNDADYRYESSEIVSKCFLGLCSFIGRFVNCKELIAQHRRSQLWQAGDGDTDTPIL